MKRTYSINLAAYVMSTTDIVPDIFLDEDSNTYFFTFSQCKALDVAIKEYKCGRPRVDLHDFLHSIKQIRTSIQAKKGGESNGNGF